MNGCWKIEGDDLHKIWYHIEDIFCTHTNTHTIRSAASQTSSIVMYVHTEKNAVNMLRCTKKKQQQQRTKTDIRNKMAWHVANEHEIYTKLRFWNLISCAQSAEIGMVTSIQNQNWSGCAQQKETQMIK